MRKKLIYLTIALVVIAAILGSLATFWTEYEWFKNLKFESVYLTQLTAKVTTGVVFGLVAFFFLLIHVHFIKRFSKPRKDWTIPTPEGDIDIKEIVSKVSGAVVITAALVAASAMGVWAAQHWEEMLRFLNQTPFNSTDPILNKDVGFYLFTLPALQYTHEWTVYLSGIGIFLPAAIYFLRGEIVMEGNYPKMTKEVRSHLLVSLAVAMLVIGFGYYVEMFETLFSKRGVAYGATYTDVNANLIVYRIMIAICVIAAGFFIYAIKAQWKRKNADMLYPAIGLGVVVGFYALGIIVYPYFLQKVRVQPNELELESPYLKHAIKNTREAFNLSNIVEQDFPATKNLSFAKIEENRPTIDNIKIWDHGPLRQTYKQAQAIRLYYDFPNVSVDRYRIGTNYWQVMLSARELVHDLLPAQSQTWVNRHLQYTHGYGACLSPVNRSGDEGLPDFWLKDIPPEARNPDLKITRPEIYYGLATNDFVLVKTTEKEFDYPHKNGNRYTTYSGKGGVNIGSFFRRLVFALRFGDVNLFFTSALKDQSRILFNRNIQERVRTLAPFLMLDSEPYITVINGRMLWIQDAYTVSYRYPYSQPFPLGRGKRVNYIRNSVKVVVDAYDGEVKLYIWDEKDPMIQTYAKIFPKLMLSRKDAPKSLIEHIRYPKDLFTIQAEMYGSFHMTDTREWYNQEDKWNIAQELPEKSQLRKTGIKPAPAPSQARGRGGRRLAPKSKLVEQGRMEPYYMIMKLPKKQKEEFLLMLPFTPNNKDNMVAWMSARCDGDNYGKLLVYTFPKKKLIFGPMQIEARIDQDAHISQWITLRDRNGSKVIRGDLLVIPIEDSILYVEPIFLQADRLGAPGGKQTQLPELKQVIVAFDERLAMENSLAEALKSVFNVSKDSSQIATSQPSTRYLKSTDNATGLAAKALHYYRQGEAALKRGDWTEYGKAQRELKIALEMMAKRLEGNLKPTSAPTSQPVAK